MKLNSALIEKDKIGQDKFASEQEKTAAAIKERDVFKAQAEFYESALKAATKKRSKWCGFLKFITFRIIGCR